MHGKDVQLGLDFAKKLICQSCLCFIRSFGEKAFVPLSDQSCKSVERFERTHRFSFGVGRRKIEALLDVMPEAAQSIDQVGIFLDRRLDIDMQLVSHEFIVKRALDRVFCSCTRTKHIS